MDTKLPNHGRGWGVHVRSDIEIYLNVLEFIHAAAGGEGVEVLFRINPNHTIILFCVVRITLLLPCAWDEHEEPQFSMMIRMLGGDHKSFSGVTAAANL